METVFKEANIMRSFGPEKKFAACILQRRYISVISVENYINVCGRYVSMRLLKPVDYKLKVHLIIITASMLEFQLDPVSRVTGIPGWYWILGIKCSDTTVSD